MQTLRNYLATIICLQPKCLSSKWRRPSDQKSRPLMTRPSGVQYHKGSYRITLLGVSRDLPTSQTTSITISISVVSTLQNTFGTMQLEFRWHLFNAMSKQFIRFVALGPQGGESKTHQEMIQFFSGWGRVRIATWVDCGTHSRTVEVSFRRRGCWIEC